VSSTLRERLPVPRPAVVALGLVSLFCVLASALVTVLLVAPGRWWLRAVGAVGVGLATFVFQFS